MIKYIATNIKSNIRELEGALTKIVALSKLDHNKEIDIALAEEALKDIISPNAERKITSDLPLLTLPLRKEVRISLIPGRSACTSVRRSQVLPFRRSAGS